MAWGKKGAGPGEFNLPHAIRLDAAGQVYVGDRENDRVQVFDANGKFLRQFGGFAPFGLFITPDQTLFVATWRDGGAGRCRVRWRNQRKASSEVRGALTLKELYGA